MTHYLDASALVSMFCEDTHTLAIRRLLGGAARPVVSDCAVAEFAAAIARRQRDMGLHQDQAAAVWQGFETWCAGQAQRVDSSPADLAAAAGLMRQAALRATEALHLAIAARMRSVLVTVDRRLAAAATSLGITVAEA